MSFATLADQERTLSGLSLPTLLSQNAAATVNLDPRVVDHYALDQTLGRFFKNPEVEVRISDPQAPVVISTTGGFCDFRAMTARRTDLRANTDLWSRDSAQQLSRLGDAGVPLSNVGVSLALTVEIGGQEYALLITRAVKNERGEPKVRLMLPSGYVDAAKIFNREGLPACDPDGAAERLSSRGLFVANALLEGREELLGATAPGWFSHLRVSRAFLGHDVLGELAFLHGSLLKRFGHQDMVFSGAYPGLSYHEDLLHQMVFTELPPFVTNVFPSKMVIIDGQELRGAGFQIHEHTNSGQIILGGRLTLPAFASPDLARLFSLLLAEDGPGNLDGQPGDLLATRLHTFGAVPSEFNRQTGEITGPFYNYMKGTLVAALHLGGPDNLMMADTLFRPGTSWSGRPGFLNRAHVPQRGYFSGA